MRKNLLILALALLGSLPSPAKPALFLNPLETSVSDNVTCTAGTLTGDYGAMYTRHAIYNVSHFRKSNAATTAVGMTIDLTAAAKVTEPTKLLTFESTHELGLIATPEGITGNWHGAPWGETVSYGKLATHPAAFRRDGAHYITLTVVASGCSGAGWNGVGGIMGYNVGGELLINLPRLASAENKSFTAIHANTDLIKCLSVNPEVSRTYAEVPPQAAAQAAKTERKYLKYRGEWLSPTQWTGIGILALLLLGAVSIFLIRRGKW